MVRQAHSRIPRTLQVKGPLVPAGAVAVIKNVTVNNGLSGSYLTVYPAGSTVPNVSNLNFAAEQTIPNLVTLKLSDDVGMVAALATVLAHTKPTTHRGCITLRTPNEQLQPHL